MIWNSNPCCLDDTIYHITQPTNQQITTSLQSSVNMNDIVITECFGNEYTIKRLQDIRCYVETLSISFDVEDTKLETSSTTSVQSLSSSRVQPVMYKCF